MPNPELGERMSKIVNMEDIVIGEDGEVYATKIQKLIGKPIAPAALLYVHLRRAFPDMHVEVWWDHFSMILVASIVTPYHQRYRVVWQEPHGARVQVLEWVHEKIRVTKLEVECLL